MTRHSDRILLRRPPDGLLPINAQTAGLASRIFDVLQSRDDGAKPTTLSRNITLPQHPGLLLRFHW